MRLIRLRGKLNEIKASAGVDLLVFEAARNAGPKMQGALVVQAELQGVIVLWCEDNKAEYRGFSPSEIKKFASGSGNCSKSIMLDLARKKWGNVSDDNEADARWLLALTQREYEDKSPPVATNRR